MSHDGRRRRRPATTLCRARRSRGSVGRPRSCSAASASACSASCCSVGSWTGSFCHERARARAQVRARPLARVRRRSRRRASRAARPRSADRGAARERGARRGRAQVRHGRAAALAASVSRPLLQLHAARAAARRAHDAAWTEHEPRLVERHARHRGLVGRVDRARDFRGEPRCRSPARISSAGWRGRGRGSGRISPAHSRWSKLLAPAGAGYASWHPLASFAATYLVFTALFAIGARSMQLDVRRFVAGFTVLFVVTWAAWVAGNELHLTMVDAAVDGRNRYRDAALSWGLQLGEGAPYLLALIAGLAIGNFAKGFAAARLAEAARPEWYIKTAIVFLGRQLGRADDRSERLRGRADPDGRRRDVRRLPVFLADRLRARAQRVRLQARCGRRARVRHFRMRRLGRDRDGGRDPREARHSRHDLDGRRDLRDDRAHRPAAACTRRSLPISRSSTAPRSA